MSVHSVRKKRDCYVIEINDHSDGSFIRLYADSRIDINDALSEWLYNRSSVYGYQISVRYSDFQYPQ